MLIDELERLDKDKLNREERLAKRLSKFFNVMMKDLLGKLEHHKVNSFNIKKYKSKYYNIISEFDVDEFKNGVLVGERMVKYVNTGSHKSKLPSLKLHKKDYWSPYKHTIQDLLQIVFIACERTLMRVDDSIKELIKDAYITGEGIDFIGEQIRERFNQLKTWEAVRIARTECHNAHNRGVVSAYTNYGVNYTMWISSHDNRVRTWKKKDLADHTVLDGQIIPLGKKYSNGLHYPGDISGPLYEFINCRCANAPYVVPPGYMPPPGKQYFYEKDLIKIK